MPPTSSPAPRTRAAASARAILLAIFALALAAIAPATAGAAVGQPWTPSPAALVKTPRLCPSPAVARVYDASCWTVSEDPTSPLFSAAGAWAQCTYWALELRPDLWNNRSAQDPNAGNWTAYTWPAHARLEGLAVDHTAATGAIAVWPRTSADPSGHVAYVDSARPGPARGDEQFTVEEFNDTTFDDPTAGQGDTITLTETASELAAIDFIHAPGAAVSSTSVTDLVDHATAQTFGFAGGRNVRAFRSRATGWISRRSRHSLSGSRTGRHTSGARSRRHRRVHR